jgi:thioredoxin reductase (NADPH)
LQTTIFSPEIGGAMATAFEIENYPGFKKITGRDLAEKMRTHAAELGVKFETTRVLEIEKRENFFEIRTEIAGDFRAKTVILATGTRHRKLEIPSEKKFAGRGVSFCATCDGYFFRDQTVAIVGGGDSAATAAVFLGEICEKIFLIFRGEKMRAEPFWIDKINANKKIEQIPKTNVAEFSGGENLEKIKLDTGREISVNGAFVQIGLLPETTLADKLSIKKDERGFLKVAKNQATNIDGIFAAGDVTNSSNNFEQVATAISEGAVAANSAFFWIQKNFEQKS